MLFVTCKVRTWAPSPSAPKFQITPIGFSRPPNVLCPLSTLGSSYLHWFPPVYLGSSVLSFICRLKQQNISGHFPLCSRCTLHVVVYSFSCQTGSSSSVGAPLSLSPPQHVAHDRCWVVGEGRQACLRPRAGVGTWLVMWRLHSDKKKKTITFPEDNIGENLDDLRFIDDFLDRTSKAQSMEEIIIWTSL